MTTDKIIPFPAPVLKESEHSSFTEQVAKRFRLVPNFFVSAPDAPEVIERLWAFAAAAYLDNPIPTLFKERLFSSSRVLSGPLLHCAPCGFLWLRRRSGRTGASHADH